MRQESYIYKNIPIPGGGYVTGFLFDEHTEGKLYIRTDIGGTYSLDCKDKKWESLCDHVTMKDLRESYPIALALDDKGALYIVSGAWREKHAKLSITKDNGCNFTHYELPFMAHGNLNGRGTGSKLIIDRKNGERLWYASQTQGLWRSEDGGRNFSKIEVLKEDYLTFVAQSPDGSSLIVGSAGVTCSADDGLRGPALYISNDDGESFSVLPQPDNVRLPETEFSGVVPQRYSMDDKYLYVTFQAMGPNAKNRELGYSCDGGSVWNGKIYRYSLFDFSYKDITPSKEILKKGANPMDSGGTFGRKNRLIEENNLDILGFGFGGISTCLKCPGLVATSTLSCEGGDSIFRSRDYGDTWEVILHDLDTGVMDFRTEYMKPCYNGGHNLVHWMSDLKIDPFDPMKMWFNTGTGPFMTENLLDNEVHFSDFADGIEETVHINVYSPHEGDVKVLDIVGDLGGFAFKDLDRPCDNSFADSDGNRYITCLNADYSDIDPQTVIVTARGNWTGRTKGGLILSENQGDTFERLEMPYGLSDKIDSLLGRIERPNVNPGWVAMSPGCNNIVWSVCDGFFLPVDAVVASNDGGCSFEKAKIFNLQGECISDKKVTELSVLLKNGTPKDLGKEAMGIKVFSDRIKDDVFYGFGLHGEFYVSTDGGCSFEQKRLSVISGEEILTDNILGCNFAYVDTINKTDIRPDNGKSGIFYLGLHENGLWKLVYNFEDDYACLHRLTGEGSCVYRMGLGVGRKGGSFLSEPKAVYMAAEIEGEYGFYRSLDECKTYERINDSRQMYGEINSICGDAREFGRVYVATGSRGLLYGERAVTRCT